MSMCVNNYVASTAANNSSAFVQNTVKIKIPWQMGYLVQSNGRAFPRKYIYIQMN